LENRNDIPPPSSIQYDGFFNNYYFPLENDNDKDISKSNIINADVSFKLQRNIINNKEENYISILLNSNRDGKKEITKSLDIVVVLDISSSMSSCL